jgi:hypothetical protein
MHTNRRQAFQFRCAGFFGHWIRSQHPFPAAVGELIVRACLSRMNKELHITLLLLLVMLTGCMHFSEVEVRSSDSGVLIPDAKAVEKEVGDVLATSNFAPVLDKRFEQHQRANPNFVAEWERREDRGFWHGTEYMSVEMYAKGDLIRLVVSSGTGARKDVVEAIRVTLAKMIRDKFPDLKVDVRSSSYFPLGAP